MNGDLSRLVAALRAPAPYVFTAQSEKSVYVCRVHPSRRGYLIGLEYGSEIVWFTDEDDGPDDLPPGSPADRFRPPASPCDDRASNGSASVASFGPAITGAVAAGSWEGAVVAPVSTR